MYLLGMLFCQKDKDLTVTMNDKSSSIVLNFGKHIVVPLSTILVVAFERLLINLQHRALETIYNYYFFSIAGYS